MSQALQSLPTFHRINAEPCGQQAVRAGHLRSHLLLALWISLPQAHHPLLRAWHWLFPPPGTHPFPLPPPPPHNCMAHLLTSFKPVFTLSPPQRAFPDCLLQQPSPLCLLLCWPVLDHAPGHPVSPSVLRAHPFAVWPPHRSFIREGICLFCSLQTSSL